jgi:hypothetical protein
VRVVTKRQPRQYMNRRGGFNRPLPPERNRWGGEKVWISRYLYVDS